MLKGQALVTDNGVESVLNPGDYHMCKDGDSHALPVTGTRPWKSLRLSSMFRHRDAEEDILNGTLDRAACFGRIV